MDRKVFFIAAVFLLIVVVVTTIALVVTLNKSNKSTKSKSIEDEYPIIATDCGKVEGKKFYQVTIQGLNTSVYEFRNIPYAVPPVASLRWKPPIPLNKDKSKCWKDTLKFNKKVISCFQLQTASKNYADMTEDCLVLTVRTPNIDKNIKLPVLLWLHSGGMLYGNNEMRPASFPNREFTAALNVVSVSINYRLNVLGFLSLRELWIKSGPERSYGNYGIMDQVLALKWVRENIENFGGDPNHVTIYGQSGGATAVYCLLSSPLARGLFHKAIASSGVPNIRTNYTEADKKFRTILNITNCNRSSSEDVRTCLQNLNPNIILSAVNNYKNVIPYKMDHFPENKPVQGYSIEIIDPVVVTTTPGEISPTVGNTVDILMSTLSEEGGPSVGGSYLFPRFFNWTSLVSTLSPKVNTFKDGLTPSLVSMYRNKSNDKVSPNVITPVYVYKRLLTDILLSCTTNNVAERLGKIPNYKVNRVILSQPPTPNIGLGSETFHGWDSIVVFNIKYFSEKISKNDLKLVKNIRGVFKAFVHYTSLFNAMYGNKTIELWNNTIYTWNHKYHEKECKVLLDNGFINCAAGNLGN